MTIARGLLQESCLSATFLFAQWSQPPTITFGRVMLILDTKYDPWPRTIAEFVFVSHVFTLKLPMAYFCPIYLPHTIILGRVILLLATRYNSWPQNFVQVVFNSHVFFFLPNGIGGVILLLAA